MKDKVFARTGNQTRDSGSKAQHAIHKAIASHHTRRSGSKAQYAIHYAIASRRS